jgi:hypothetical protein
MRFDRSRRRARRAPDTDRGDLWKTITAIAVVVLVLVIVAGWTIASQRVVEAGLRNPETMCLLKGAPPRATLAMLDETDTLAADSGERFTRLIRRIRDDLPRNGRLLIAPFGGDLGASLATVFDICSPGRGAEADGTMEGSAQMERNYVAKFGRPLDKVADTLRNAGISHASPITEQIERATNDPAIKWSGTERDLIILTDGLQNTATSPVYINGVVRLPDAPPGLLDGVTVSYVELANPRHSALQTHAMREAWKAWFIAAGASRVKMYAPGYPPPDDKTAAAVR